MVLGFAESEAVGVQLAFEGADAEHEPSHWIVPLFVCPQMLALEVQALP